jgi:NAD(P)-dependent dehydrogenase (short-subunit alcohol dehydrogenase family)
LVTGASGEIGGATVMELLKSPDNLVFGFDLRPFPQDLLKTGVSTNYHHALGDVIKEDTIAKARDAIAAQPGELRGIVNCFFAPEAPLRTKYKYDTDPGIDVPGEKRNLAIIDAVMNYSGEEFLRELNINLVGLHNVFRVFNDLILKSRGVSIVNLASQYGIKVPNQDLFTNRKKFVCKLPGYSTSKAGVISYTEYMASIYSGREDRNLVRFNCVAPGTVYRNHSPEFVENYNRFTWNSRMAHIEDAVAGIMFLLSPSSTFMNGTTLEIDGGWVRK